MFVQRRSSHPQIISLSSQPLSYQLSPWGAIRSSHGYIIGVSYQRQVFDVFIFHWNRDEATYFESPLDLGTPYWRFKPETETCYLDIQIIAPDAIQIIKPREYMSIIQFYLSYNTCTDQDLFKYSRMLFWSLWLSTSKK